MKLYTEPNEGIIIIPAGVSKAGAVIFLLLGGIICLAMIPVGLQFGRVFVYGLYGGLPLLLAGLIWLLVVREKVTIVNRFDRNIYFNRRQSRYQNFTHFTHIVMTTGKRYSEKEASGLWIKVNTIYLFTEDGRKRELITSSRVMPLYYLAFKIGKWLNIPFTDKCEEPPLTRRPENMYTPLGILLFEQNRFQKPMQERPPRGLEVHETKNSLRLTWSVKKALVPIILILGGIGLDAVAFFAGSWNIQEGWGGQTPMQTTFFILLMIIGFTVIVIGLRRIRGHGINELLINAHGITYTTKFPMQRSWNVPLRNLLYIGGDPLNSQRDLMVFLHRAGNLPVEIYPEFYRYMKYRIEHFIWGKGSRDINENWSH